ncbi:hypothetical protein GCM10027048_22280 [Hymenobacter coalescens]
MVHSLTFSRFARRAFAAGLLAWAGAWGSPTAAQSPAPSAGAAKRQGYELRGQLSHAAPGTRVLLTELSPQAPGRLDSAVTDAQGRFRLRGRVAEAAVYALRLPEQPEPVPVALGPGARVQFAADARQPLATARQTGTADAQLLQALQAVLQRHRQRTQELIRQNEQRSEPWNAAWGERLTDTKHLIRRHPASWVAAYALVDLSGYSREESFLDSATAHFAAALPASRYTRALLARRAARQVTAVGRVAPDLVLPGPDGQPVALASLRGRYVLLDFWASWCKPCRAENPAMVRLYQQYHARGFEMYAVSLDDSREQWLKAIAADQLPWVQVSDLQGFRSPSVEVYDARAVPLTVLLDPQGRVVAKDLRGQELAAKLATLIP